MAHTVFAGETSRIRCQPERRRVYGVNRKLKDSKNTVLKVVVSERRRGCGVALKDGKNTALSI